MKFLYFNGDSMATGYGTLLHELDANLGGMTYSKSSFDFNTIVENNNRIAKLHDTIPAHKFWAYEEKSKLSAFPHIAAKMLGIKFINNAQSGASLSQICLTTIQDIKQLLRDYDRTEIHAVITLTSPERILVPFEGDMRSIGFGRKARGDLQTFSSLWDKHGTRHIVVSSSLGHLMGLLYFLQREQISHTFLDSHMFGESEFAQDFTHLVEFTMFDLFNEHETCYTACGHFNSFAQTRIAGRLVELLRERTN